MRIISIITVILPALSFAQDTIPLQPIAVIPGSQILCITSGRLIISVAVKSQDRPYPTDDTLFIYDISEPWAPRIVGRSLPLRSLGMMAPIFGSDYSHPSALLFGNVIVSGMNRSYWEGDVFGFRSQAIGPLGLAGESLDSGDRWELTFQDSLFEQENGDTANPQGMNHYAMPGKMTRIGNYLIYAAGSWGIRIYDLTDPMNPRELDTLDYICCDLEIFGSEMILIRDGELIALDLTDMENIHELWRFTFANEDFPYRYPAFEGSLVFFQRANYLNPEPETPEYFVIDVSGAEGPENVGSFDLGFDPHHYTPFVASEGHFYVKDGATITAYTLTNGWRPEFLKLVRVSDDRDYLRFTARANLVFLAKEYPGWNGVPFEALIYDVAENSVHSSPLIPSTLSLFSFPNPFNSSTTISYTLPKSGWTTIDVVDLNGRLVKRLSDEWKEAGSYREVWDGKGTASGSYLLMLQSPGGSQTTTIELIK